MGDIIGYLASGIAGVLFGALAPLALLYPKLARLESKVDFIMVAVPEIKENKNKLAGLFEWQRSVEHSLDEIKQNCDRRHP